MIRRPTRTILAGALVLLSTLASSSIAQTPNTRDLYFVAVGDVSPVLMQHLVLHFQRAFDLTITVLSPMSLDPLAIDPQRKQVIADELILSVRRRHATLARDARARVIGITPHDMYNQAMREKWSFSFSLRGTDNRFAVVSHARMDPVNLGAPPDAELLRSRLRKMLMKNIGIMYYGLPASRNPRSAMFVNILGVDDLDRMTEQFDPK